MANYLQQLLGRILAWLRRRKASGLCECGCGQATNIIKLTDTSRGRVKGQPYRFVRGHRSRPPKPVADLYEVSEGGCWEWRLYRHASGYGIVERGGRRQRAHRWMYEQQVGPIPDGLYLYHLCRNRGCVNPDHLTPVVPGRYRQHRKEAA